ncbi:hypothetical protein EVAR_103333_1 [Eumeta japonica]|uniref:Uncharacterized protein n=1 Tax=Eumeta variegata TaxID=151549 RepID=A0A4C1Z808_EUMVA|nr:hypothetical protein EVAR_103333_1 [Eumeta japonica]
MLRREGIVVKRIRQEVVHQRAKGHPVRPARREVLQLHILPARVPRSVTGWDWLSVGHVTPNHAYTRLDCQTDPRRCTEVRGRDISGMNRSAAGGAGSSAPAGINVATVRAHGTTQPSDQAERKRAVTTARLQSVACGHARRRCGGGAYLVAARLVAAPLQQALFDSGGARLQRRLRELEVGACARARALRGRRRGRATSGRNVSELLDFLAPEHVTVPRTWRAKVRRGANAGERVATDRSACGTLGAGGAHAGRRAAHKRQGAHTRTHAQLPPCA